MTSEQDNAARLEALDHVALTVSDLARSRLWYADVLGLHPVQTDPEVFVPYVTNGKVNVALLPVRDGQQFTPPSHQGPRGCHAAFSASGDSFLAFIERFQREGVPFEMLLHGYCRSIYFEDPDGYVIEVTTYDLDVPKSAE